MLGVISSRIMARTTLDLDSSVLRQLKQRGREEHKSMGQIASELLAHSLSRSPAEHSASPIDWRSWNLGKPRVDLEDKEAVRRALEKPG